jgi:predicted MPP superfamily phosphohydrolase
MVAPMERLGIQVLANQTIELNRGSATVLLTGIDDVHYYYTEDALDALYDGGGGFRVVAVHSPEFAAQAAAAGARLYLAGHTHGGQICLPGGSAILTHAITGRKYVAGRWRHGDMTGYTSCGTGISGLPVRYNNRGEVTLLTLRRKAD